MTPEHREALTALQFALSWWDGIMPIELAVPGVRGLERTWQRLDARRSLADRVDLWDFELSAQVALGLPHRRRGDGPVRCSALWVRCESPESRARLRSFKPAPAIVLEEGLTLVGVWPLNRWVDGARIERANRRIAYALRAAQKWGRPETMRFAAPGSVLRDRARPVVVDALKVSAAHFTASMIVGRLRDPPVRRIENEEGK